MAKGFTYCWRYRAVLRHALETPVPFVYGSQFSARGVCPDDEVYIVSLHQGPVHLRGKVLAAGYLLCRPLP